MMLPLMWLNKSSNNKCYASPFRYIDIDVFTCIDFVLVDLFDEWFIVFTMVAI